MKLNYAVFYNNYIYIGINTHQVFKILHPKAIVCVLDNNLYINGIKTNIDTTQTLFDEEVLWNDLKVDIDFKLLYIEIIKNLIIKVVSNKWTKVIDMQNYSNNIGDNDIYDIKIINNSVGWGNEDKDYCICNDFLAIAPNYEDVKEILKEN